MWASATLALMIGAVSACGGSPSASTSAPANSCVNASAPHHAYVVVQHIATAHRLQKCVGFTGDTIDGQALMDQPGAEDQTPTFTFRNTVCPTPNDPVPFTNSF